MSFRPPFPNSNAAFAPRYNNNNSNNNFINSSNNSFIKQNNDQTNVESTFTSYNTNPSNINTNYSSNVFVPTMYGMNKSNQELMPPNRFHNAFAPRQGVPIPHPNSANTYRTNPQTTGPQHPNISTFPPCSQYYPNPPVRQNFNRNPIGNFHTSSENAYFHSDQRSAATQRFPYPGQNTVNSNSSTQINFHGYQNSLSHGISGNNVPTTFNNLPPNFSITSESNLMTSSVNVPGIVNNQASVPLNNNSSSIASSTLPNLSQAPPSQWENNSFLKMPPPPLGNNSSHAFSSNTQNSLSKKELVLAGFLTKFTTINEKDESKIMVPEYRSALRDAFSLLKLLSERKLKLKNLLEANEIEWSSEVQSIRNLQGQLSEMCSLLSSPNHLNNIVNKLKHIKKKRAQKKKTKLNKLSEKIKAEQNRKELHQEIDKWLDDIKEKNLKLKREVEMKKEADFILLEVRKKIQEANRTIEKIKVFEKLRNARQANAAQKGLHIMPEHNENFEKNVSILKSTMLKQLVDYEAEEKALKVMLETEQEGQLEEKTQWELKKIKNLQQKKQNHITECLFGISEDPLPTDSLYLFHKYHTAAYNGIENLVQIRHQWDLHIAEDGESIPQHWVVPVAPNDSSWEKCLITSKN